MHVGGRRRNLPDQRALFIHRHVHLVTTHNAFSRNLVAFSQSGPLNPTASIWISPVIPMMISMVLFI